MSQENEGLNKLLAKIPRNSSILKYPKSAQYVVIDGIINDRSIERIQLDLKEHGYDISDQQVRRIKKHLLPAWKQICEPRTIDFTSVEDVLDKMEMILDNQYKRMIQAIEDEQEGKDLLEPVKYIDFEEISVTRVLDLVKAYYDAEISENDKKVLFTFMRPRGRQEFLFKEINNFQKTLEDYIALRQKLGDDRMRIEPKDVGAKVIKIHGSDEEVQKIETSLKEKVKKAIDGRKKD